MVIHLKPEEFTAEQFAPIFKSIAAEIGKPERFKEEYFFPNWHNLMRTNISETYAVPGAVLGSLFYPDVFNGELRASIMFWFSLPEARGTGRPIKLLDKFEARASERGAKMKSGAAFGALVPGRLRRIFEKRGYFLSEEIFSKYE